MWIHLAISCCIFIGLTRTSSRFWAWQVKLLSTATNTELQIIPWDDPKFSACLKAAIVYITCGRMEIRKDWLRFSLIRYREITGKMCQGVVPTCQHTSCSPSQNPEGNCSVWNTEAGRRIHLKIPNNDQLLNIEKSVKGLYVTVRTDRRGSFNSLDCSLEDFSRQPKVGGATVYNTLIIVVLSKTKKSQVTNLLDEINDWPLNNSYQSHLTSLQSMLRSCPLTSIRTMMTS